jgi:hypothetical protein
MATKTIKITGNAAAAPLPPRVVELGKGADGGPATECRVCGSKRRTAYESVREQTIDGTRFRWLRCKCLACEQTRVDRVEDKLPPPPEPTPAELLAQATAAEALLTERRAAAARAAAEQAAAAARAAAKLADQAGDAAEAAAVAAAAAALGDGGELEGDGDE